jgi:hypothetical protein
MMVNEDTADGSNSGARSTQGVVDFADVVAINNNEVEGGATDVPLTMDEIKDGVVSDSTTAGYIGSILCFLMFCADSTIGPYNQVLTDFGHDQLRILQQQVGERFLDYGRRKKLIMNLLLTLIYYLVMI